MADDAVNFANTTVQVAPSPANSGTTMTLVPGPPSPTPPYDLTLWQSGQPQYNTAEIVRVLAQSGNVVSSMTRAQYGTSALDIAVGWNAAQNLTSAMLQQLGGASVGVNNDSLVTSGEVALQITTQPTIPASGIIPPLPPLIGFGFSGASIPITLSGATPEGVCVGRDGNVWVADFNGNVWRVTPEGVATSFALLDSTPISICSGPDGNLWVADNTGFVWQVTLGGVPTSFALTGARPNWICAGPDGNLWVSDQSANYQLWKVTTGGVPTAMPLGGTIAALGICAGPDGNLWWSDGPLVGNMTTDGVVTTFAPDVGLDPLQGICSGPDGNLWFTQTGSFSGEPSVWRITTEGIMTQFALDGNPYGICVGAGGDLWVPNTTDGFWKITPDGRTTKFTFGEGLIWVCSGPDGSLWVSDQVTDIVYIAPFTVLMGNLQTTAMPTSAAGLVAGTLWNNSGVVNVA